MEGLHECRSWDLRRGGEGRGQIDIRQSTLADCSLGVDWRRPGWGLQAGQEVLV